jgi:AcrR family transcriptional regulator
MKIKDEAKEALILQTALGIINRVGLAGLKMSDLAKEARMATGTVYIYFADKEELVRRLYLFLSQKQTQDLMAEIPSNDPTKLKIQKLAFSYLKNSLENPEYAAFFEQYYRSPFFSETAELDVAADGLMQPIYEMVLRGQEEHIIKNLPAELLVTLVCGMLNELARQAMYEKRLVTDEEWKGAFSVLWDGIKA